MSKSIKANISFKQTFKKAIEYMKVDNKNKYIKVLTEIGIPVVW